MVLEKEKWDPDVGGRKKGLTARKALAYETNCEVKNGFCARIEPGVVQMPCFLRRKVMLGCFGKKRPFSIGLEPAEEKEERRLRCCLSPTRSQPLETRTFSPAAGRNGLAKLLDLVRSDAKELVQSFL